MARERRASEQTIVRSLLAVVLLCNCEWDLFSMSIRLLVMVRGGGVKLRQRTLEYFVVRLALMLILISVYLPADKRDQQL